MLKLVILLEIAGGIAVIASGDVLTRYLGPNAYHAAYIVDAMPEGLWNFFRTSKTHCCDDLFREIFGKDSCQLVKNGTLGMTAYAKEVRFREQRERERERETESSTDRHR